MRVHEVMRSTPAAPMAPRRLFVGTEEHVRDAVELMAVTSSPDLPVLDRDGVVVGSVSRDDVARALGRDDQEVEQEVSDLLAQIGFRHWHLTVTDGVVEVRDLGSSRDRTLARVAALVVPGVRDVVWV